MWTIGAIAAEAGVGVETIRFYERKGLIIQPKKSLDGGFRRYPFDDVTKIKFIKRAQELGFTLAEVKDLLVLNSAPRATCDDVRVRAEQKLKEVEQKMKDLRRIRKSLLTLEAACGKSKDAIACCRIMDCFEGNC
jgi:MerR family mercuric resistance operon transcriptional regulator